MIRQPIKARRKIFLGVLSVTLLVGGYLYLSHKQHLKNSDDTTIPNASQIKKGIKTLFEVNPRTEERWIVVDSKATFERFFVGLGLGILASVILGLFMGCFNSCEAFSILPLSFAAFIPPTAALAVFFVLMGTDLRMYVAVIMFGTVPTLARAVSLAVKDVPDENLDKVSTLGASNCEQVWNVVFKQILPKILDSIRLQIGPAMVFLIAAEMVCGDVGFGYRIRLQSRLLNMSVVYPCLVFLAGFGFIMDYAFKYLVKKLCPWYVAGRS